MTKIKFTKNNGYIVKMQIEGHTGYAEHGKDILCSAISALSQAVVLGLKQVLQCNINYKTDYKRGFLMVELVKPDLDVLKQANILFETARISFEDLQFENEKFMKVEVCDEIY